VTVSLLISPTGKSIRNDPKGNGGYGSPRGTRKHDGIDWLAKPGQDVVMPCRNGFLRRIIYPYASDLSYKGVVIEGRMGKAKCFIVLFYVDVANNRIGKMFSQGEVIGKAQDIAKKYGGRPMKNHVHMSVYAHFNYRDLIAGNNEGDI
jgi:hypothetical protein